MAFFCAVIETIICRCIPYGVVSRINILFKRKKKSIFSLTKKKIVDFIYINLTIFEFKTFFIAFQKAHGHDLTKIVQCLYINN